MVSQLPIYLSVWLIFQITQPGKTMKMSPLPDLFRLVPVKTNDLNPNKIFLRLFFTTEAAFLSNKTKTGLHLLVIH